VLRLGLLLEQVGVVRVKEVYELDEEGVFMQQLSLHEFLDLLWAEPVSGYVEHSQSHCSVLITLFQQTSGQGWN